MDSSHGKDFVLSDYARKTIQFKAWQLSRRPGFGNSDQDDLQQELWLMVCERAGEFDPSKSSINTFVNLIVNIAAARFVRKQMRLKRGNGKPIVSLSDCDDASRSSMWNRAVSCTQLFRRIGYYPTDPVAVGETAEAVQWVLERMPDDLRDICRL